MYHIFQFSFRKLIECMFIHSAKMIPYRLLFIIDVFMIINHYITYNRLNNLTVYNKRKTCSNIITYLLKQKNFTFIHFQSPFSLGLTTITCISKGFLICSLGIFRIALTISIILSGSSSLSILISFLFNSFKYISVGFEYLVKRRDGHPHITLVVVPILKFKSSVCRNVWRSPG